MTPNNILNMAMLKKLDFVAITDHNSAKQLETVRDIEKAYNFIVIPGIEVTVKEGFDVLCYFDNYENAFLLDKHLESFLTDQWGPFSQEDQIITDIYDNEESTFDKPLLQPTLPYQDLYDFVKMNNGIVVLAHISRGSKSALLTYQLDEIPFDGVEIERHHLEDFILQHPVVKQYPIITNSDSHSMLQLSQWEESIDLEEHSIKALFDYLKGVK